MPDHSRDIISRNNANVAVASEGQIWDSMNPDQRAQLLGQSIAGEADNSNIKNSVYQQGEGRVYETTPYTSLPPNLQFEVSNRLHKAGYFQETFGATVYEVEGDDRFECKDCEETFTAEEDLRVHRKINHDDNGESETESQEAYLRTMEIDPDMTKDNLEWAKKVVRGESSRVEYPQNDPKGPVTDPPLPKGRREYDDNPNHYFYDNKLFKRGSRGGNYDQTGTALTEARALIQLEEKILDKYGWESTKDVEKDSASRQVFAGEIAKVVTVENLHPRTIKILDSVHRPFLVNTLSKIARETEIDDIPYRGDVDQVGATQDDAPFSEQGEPVLHQDYNPEHPHEHNAFDINFGDKVAEEDDPMTDEERDIVNDINKPFNLVPKIPEPWEYGGADYKREGDPDADKAEEDNASDRKKYYDLMREQIKEEGGIDAEGEAEDIDPYTKEEKKEWKDRQPHITDPYTGKAEEEEKEYPGSYDDMKYKKSTLDQAEPTEEHPTFGFDYQKGEEDRDDDEIFWKPWEDLKKLEGEEEEYIPSEEPIGGKIENDQKTLGLPTDKRAYDVEEETEYKGFEPENELSDARKQMLDDKQYLDNPEYEDKQNIGTDYQKGGEQEEGDRTCPTCGFYSADEQELHSHVQDHALDDLTTGEEDFPFEDIQDETTVTAEPDLLQNVNTDVLQVESETYNPNEEVDQKAKETRIIQQYTGYKPKAGESVGDILDGAIDVPEERQTADETIYDRKLDGHHEDKIARELLIYHDIEYEDAIERIRSIEVNGNDITAKTLFGKKFADCNEAEISEMKAYGGEAKRSEGVKND